MATKKASGRRAGESNAISARRSASSRTTAPMEDARKRASLSEWRWRTFPVFAAFVAGLAIASFINGVPQNTLAAVVQILALLGIGYVLAHLFVTNVIIAGRLKRRQSAIDRGETPAEDFVDEVVYADEDR